MDINVDVESSIILCKTKKLKAMWTPNSSHDLNNVVFTRNKNFEDFDFEKLVIFLEDSLGQSSSKSEILDKIYRFIDANNENMYSHYDIYFFLLESGFIEEIEVDEI